MAKAELIFEATDSGVQATAAKTEAALKGIGDTAVKATQKTQRGAHLAAESIGGISRDLKSATKELNALEVGSDAFNQQAEAVGKLSNKLGEAKQEIREAVQAGQKFSDVAQATETAAGSLSTLQTKLREATTELNKLEPGTREFEQQGKAVQKLATEVDQARQSVDKFTTGSSKVKAVGTAALQASNSVGALRTKLRDARQALEGLDVGSKEFKQQATLVKKLSTELNEAEKNLKEFTGETQQVRAMTGSLDRMEQELSDANSELKKLPVGTKEFRKQKQEVDRLAQSLSKAQKGINGAVAGAKGGSGIVSKFTTELVGLAGGLIGINAIVSVLTKDLQAIQAERAEARNVKVDFEKLLATSLPNLAVEDQNRVTPIAINLAKDLGFDAGDIAGSLADLVSSGAGSLDKATVFLREAGKAFPQDLTEALSVARGALIESKATGNNNVKEVIGGVQAAQAVSQTTSVADFAGAFSSSVANAILKLGFTPEQAREEAALFSKLETRSAAAAATAFDTFQKGLTTFVPKTEFTTEAGQELGVSPEVRQQFIDATATQRATLLEAGGVLTEQFKSQLGDTGRAAIERRVTLAAQDRQTFEEIKVAVPDDATAAQGFTELQERQQVAAATLIAEGKREAIKQGDILLNKANKALTDEISKGLDNVLARSRTGLGGTLERFAGFAGRFVESTANFGVIDAFGNDETQQQYLNELKFISQSSSETSETRAVAREVLANIQLLKNRLELQQAALADGFNRSKEALNKQGNDVRKEAAATAAAVDRAVLPKPAIVPPKKPTEADPAGQQQPNGVRVAATKPPTVEPAAPQQTQPVEQIQPAQVVPDVRGEVLSAIGGSLPAGTQVTEATVKAAIGNELAGLLNGRSYDDLKGQDRVQTDRILDAQEANRKLGSLLIAVEAGQIDVAQFNASVNELRQAVVLVPTGTNEPQATPASTPAQPADSTGQTNIAVEPTPINVTSAPAINVTTPVSEQQTPTVNVAAADVATPVVEVTTSAIPEQSPTTVNVAAADVTTPAVRVTTPAVEQLTPTINVASADVTTPVIPQQLAPTVSVTIPTQQPEPTTTVAAISTPRQDIIPGGDIVPATETFADDPLLASTQPSEFELNREARDAERYDEQRTFNEALLAGISTLIATNAAGLAAAATPEVQQTQLLPGDPTDQPSPAGAIA